MRASIGPLARLLGVCCLLCATFQIAVISGEWDNRIREHKPNESALSARLPLDFIENRGQWHTATKFVAQKGTMTAAFESTAIKLHAPTERSAVLSLIFEHASQQATLVGEDRRSGAYNFFIGNDPSHWQSQVPAYASLRYRGLYPGVDVRVRAATEPLAYDVLLDAGADLEQVVIRADGTNGIEHAGDGSLLLKTAHGTLRQSPPKTWEVLPSGARRPINSYFRILDQRRYSFSVPDRDPSLPLVIDPGLDWATFLGGNGDESITGIELMADGSGDIVVAGQTASPDFPHTGGNLAPVGWTPYVARFNSSGTALVYATFFGGSFNHAVLDVALDAAGRPVVVGDTNSEDFPTTPGAYDRTPGNGFQGDYDAYVIKFDANGGGLVFSTYLGSSPGSGWDQAWRAGFDPSGNVIVAGFTTGADFPTTAGAYDRTIAGRDIFVTRLDPTGSQLMYSTLLGGDGTDEVFDMAVDGQGFVNITGKTMDTSTLITPFPTTPDGFDRTYGGGADGFVARLRLDGAGTADLKYATFLGGTQYTEAGTGIAVNPNAPEQVTVVGWTRSGDFPTTPGALLRTHFIPIDTAMGFVTRFHFPAPGSGTLVWSTLYGAPGNQTANDVAIDSVGNPIIVGATGATNPPTTERSYDRVPGIGSRRGDADAFAARLSADGSQLLYSTLLGGGGSDDTAQNVAFVGGTSVIVAGLTDSFDFPTTAGAFDTTYAADGQLSGGSAPGTIADDAFVARLTLEAPATGDAMPPPAPELRGPALGATYTAHVLGLTFDWSDVADASGIEAYHIQISPNASFSNNSASLASGWFESWVPTSIAVKSFSVSETGTFYWRVQALDRANNLGPWSAVRSFTVESPTPPAAPTLASPPNGGRFAPGNIILDWNAAARAKYYELQVDTRSDFSNPNRIWLRSLTQTRHTVSLTTEGLRWWRVRASNDSFTSSPWSAAWSFDLRNGAPAAPTPPPESPDGGSSPTGPATAVIGFTPQEPSLVAGSTTQVTVNLNGIAPTGGAVVGLASNDPSIANVPPTVTIPAGATSATFTVTSPAGQPYGGYVVVSAEYGGVTQGVLVNVAADNGVRELYSLAISGTTVSSGTTNQGSVTTAGGATLQGTVALIPGWTAGPRGAVVTLGSTNPALVSVPPQVTIPPGANSVSFAVTTQPVTTAANVVILASRCMTHRMTLQLLPPGALNSLTLNPTTVTGGAAAQGTVTLSGPAPAGGISVALSSHDPTVASVPPSVTVPAGATSATFTVSTNTVTGSGKFSSITATAGGSSRTATLNVNPTTSSDSVSITRAEYDSDRRTLRVEATSTSSSAALKAYVSASGALIGTLSNNGGGAYGGQFSWSVNPQSITVRSSLGGSATRSVTVK
jgi:hypothetical protein